MPSSTVRPARSWVSWWVIGGAIAVTIAVKLPLVGIPAWSDEGGFLQVAHDWRLGGTSGPHGLYGDHWVDRPPVLITLFGLADRLGGCSALRLLGAVAAAITVGCVAWTGHSLAGPRAARWAAVTAAALLANPLLSTYMVDGELLAAPFIAAGVGCAVRGLAAPGRGGLLLWAGSGALAVTALLTKQNMADVFVFAAAALLAGGLLGSLGPRRACALLAAFTVGVVGFGAAIAGWTLAHGTSLDGVYYAMYPFRVDAAEATAGMVTGVRERLGKMVAAALLSGLVPLAVWALLAGLRRPNRDAGVLALLTVLGFDVVSIAAGTSYWLHYLVQPVVAVAALTGVLAARGSLARVLSVAAVVSALIGWGLLMARPPQTGQEIVGEAVAGAAEPGDTIITLPGRADVNLAAGLTSSPYPYLWLLPARTLDPGGTRLKQVLAGPTAPTWVVVFAEHRDPPGPGRSVPRSRRTTGRWHASVARPSSCATTSPGPGPWPARTWTPSASHSATPSRSIWRGHPAGTGCSI